MCERAISIEHPLLTPLLPAEVSNRASRAWWTSLDTVQSSKLHADVSSILSALRVEHVNEAVVSGLSVDILLHGTVDSTGDVVIEVDGPSHYLRGDGGMSGATRFKHRMLEKSGVKVLHVPHFEWDDLHNEAAKKQYMKEMLNTK